MKRQCMRESRDYFVPSANIVEGLSDILSEYLPSLSFSAIFGNAPKVSLTLCLLVWISLSFVRHFVGMNQLPFETAVGAGERMSVTTAFQTGLAVGVHR